MVDESMDKEQLAQEPQPWEYRSKKAYQKLKAFKNLLRLFRKKPAKN